MPEAPAVGSRRRAPGFLLAVPAWLWLLVFFVAPFLQVAWFSFGKKPGLFGTHDNSDLSLDRYHEAMSSAFFQIFKATAQISIIGTALCLLIGLPVAYWMAAKVPSSRRGLVVALVMVPYWTNFLLRTIGWAILLAPDGLVSSVIGHQLHILNTRAAVQLGVVYNYLPLMILPLYVAFDRVSPVLREASKDLGATRWRTFTRVTLPLAKPGIVAGVLLVFIPLMGDYVTATVLGGAKGTMVGQMVASEFLAGQNWALGSAMAIVLILITLLTVAVFFALWYLLVTLPTRARHRVVLASAGGSRAGTEAVAA